ncbi:MAG TPA: hypothetical protein VHZ73_03820 [Vicinamibacterales bacterium]|jgi:hypothetical protein|nr:hypothetical protein [Vicinamibacterales bacterium]
MSKTIDVLPPAIVRPERAESASSRLNRIARDVKELASAEGASAEFIEALADLGPVFSGFGRYLSTRADVVPAGLRSDLAPITDRVNAAPASEVRELLGRAWRRPVDAVCFEFDDVPLETRFPAQAHRAWLTPMDAVRVWVVPGSFEARAHQDMRELPLLGPALSAAVGGQAIFEGLVAGYRAMLTRLLDFSDDVATSEALVADARRFPPLRPRRPHAGLSSSKVAVWDEIASVPSDTAGFNHEEAGPSVCRAWLRQALLGRVFPEETAAADFVIAGRRQIAVGGRLFATLPSDTQITVQGYLVASAAGDPDLAIKYLTRELVPGPTVDRAGFERRMRHAWSVDSDAAGGSELLAQLLLHWRIAVEHGYQVTPRLVSFYRGCLAAVTAATALGADADVLRDTLESLQIRLMAFQLETMTGVTTSAMRTVREAGWRFLTAIASGPIAADRPMSVGTALPLTTAGALLLALVAIGVALPSLVASGAAWLDQAGAVMFALLGGTLIWAIVRRRS